MIVFVLILLIGIVAVYTNIQHTFNKTNYIQTSTFHSTLLINKVSEV